jgi:hypothetical protein
VDETDAQIYAARPAEFDRLLAKQRDAESRADGILDPVPGITTYGLVSVPWSVRNEVFSMEIPDPAQAGRRQRVWFVPPPFDRQDPPIPLWRQIGPGGHSDPLNNEFTMQETLSPTALLFGALLGTDWRPPQSLLQREPTPRERLGDWLYPP